jgi:hypothetical protein
MGRKDVMHRTEGAVADLPAVKVRGIAVGGIVEGKECVLPKIPRADIGRRCMRLPFEDLGLLRKVMRLDLSPSRISVTVALQIIRHGSASVQRLPGSIMVFRTGIPGFLQ